MSRTLHPADPPGRPFAPTDDARIPIRSDDATRLALLNEIGKLAIADIELSPMLERITDAIRSAFDWQFVACILIDRENERFRCLAVSSDLPSEIVVGYSRALGSGVIGEVAMTGQPILLNDVKLYPNYVETMAGVKSELCVPVRHRGELVAILNAESTREAAFDNQLTLMETVADQIAGSIASAVLYGELKRRAEDLELIREISSIAIEESELASLLTRLARATRDEFDLVISSVVLLDQKRSTIEYIARRDQAEIIPREGVPVNSEGIIGRAVGIGSSQHVADVASDPDYVPYEPRTRSEFVVPIQFGGNVLGAMNLESDSNEVFSESNRRVFEMIATQVAGAIHRAKVNERLSEAYEELEEKNRTIEIANAELQLANHALDTLSRHDALTGLANRRHFDEMLELEWKRALRTDSELSLLVIDVDCFKSFNDTYGHVQGDDALRRIGHTLAQAIQRAGDVVARYGGEEFVALLPATSAATAGTIGETIRQSIIALDVPHLSSPAASTLSVSVGVASRAKAMTTSSELLVAADDALYRAKRLGRNRVDVHIAGTSGSPAKSE